MSTSIVVYDDISLDKLSDNINGVSDLIMKYYLEEMAKGSVPSVNSIVDAITYDVSAQAYDLIYGIGEGDISQDDVLNVLTANKCVFRFFTKDACDAQISIFDDLFDDVEVFV